MKSDFIVKDNGREYRVFPISNTAKEIIKKDTGVIQRQICIPYHNFDRFQEWASKLAILIWTYE